MFVWFKCVISNVSLSEVWLMVVKIIYFKVNNGDMIFLRIGDGYFIIVDINIWVVVDDLDDDVFDVVK